jgi:hypothetical protein
MFPSCLHFDFTLTSFCIVDCVAQIEVPCQAEETIQSLRTDPGNSREFSGCTLLPYRVLQDTVLVPNYCRSDSRRKQQKGSPVHHPFHPSAVLIQSWKGLSYANETCLASPSRGRLSCLLISGKKLCLLNRLCILFACIRPSFPTFTASLQSWPKIISIFVKHAVAQILCFTSWWSTQAPKTRLRHLDDLTGSHPIMVLLIPIRCASPLSPP